MIKLALVAAVFLVSCYVVIKRRRHAPKDHHAGTSNGHQESPGAMAITSSCSSSLSREPESKVFHRSPSLSDWLTEH
ncbi:hypothetical protein PR202_gb25288 [Eleusine coracana subsp. coracana]|uniref:Secreted protein n=1 Tax=Eleusine coracana subsp. coracana TaxID=191504 RepID=A0AAV5FKY9_ELECO|nr:hypothetical protein PR202_gb25288 [Eleusine coracana subsp. coracana]